MREHTNNTNSKHAGHVGQIAITLTNIVIRNAIMNASCSIMSGKCSTRLLLTEVRSSGVDSCDEGRMHISHSNLMILYTFH